VFEAPIKYARPRRCEARQARDDLVLLREDAERRLLAAEAVVDARFVDAVDLIEGASLRDSRSRSHGQLLRSAAYFNLYLLHGATDPVELQAAVEAALRAKEDGPSLELPERSFSPRFIRFFEGISLASAPSGR
jgi:hypothetical protein